MSRVIVGLSGGVDSAVAALRLLEQGYDVEAVFMKNWEDDDRADYCAAAQDLADAQAVCTQLGIQLRAVNFAEYWDRVFRHFLSEYRAGRTPNPDVICNQEIKFKAFLDYARALGAERIATGHYARVAGGDDGLSLLKGIDPNKDQSYFLHRLGQAQLRRSLFPVGDLTKPQVRALAAAAGLSNQAKKDSTGICFIGERRFKAFLGRYLPAQPGPIVDPDGELLGCHDGLMFHTLGQRHGLGIGGRHGGSGEPWYVVDKDLDRNLLVVAQGHDHPLLFRRRLVAQDLHWIRGQAPPLPLSCHARVRYRQQEQPCTIESLDGGHCRVLFDEPQRAVTPGQSVVFYAGETCLGGGIIETAADGEAGVRP